MIIFFYERFSNVVGYNPQHGDLVKLNCDNSTI